MNISGIESVHLRLFVTHVAEMAMFDSFDFDPYRAALRGEPIVTTRANAYSTFSRSEMDCLVLGNRLIERAD